MTKTLANEAKLITQILHYSSLDLGKDEKSMFSCGKQHTKRNEWQLCVEVGLKSNTESPLAVSLLFVSLPHLLEDRGKQIAVITQIHTHPTVSVSACVKC